MCGAGRDVQEESQLYLNSRGRWWMRDLSWWLLELEVNRNHTAESLQYFQFLLCEEGLCREQSG